MTVAENNPSSVNAYVIGQIYCVLSESLRIPNGVCAHTTAMRCAEQMVPIRA